MPGIVFADVAPPAIFLPFVGGIGAAALFGVLAVIAGGFWLAYGTSAAPRARQWFLISLGAVSLGIATFLSVIALEQSYAWAAVVAFAIIGVILFRMGIRTRITPLALASVDEKPSA